MKINLLKLTIFLMTLISSQFSFSAGNASGTCGSLTLGWGNAILLGSVTLSPLAPVGSIIGSEFSTNLVGPLGATLAPSSTNKPPYYFTFTIQKPVASNVTYNGATVYQTGYSGIGLAVWGDSYTSGPKILISNTTTAGSYSKNLNFAFIKTGTVTASGGISVNLFSNMAIQCQNSSGATITSPIFDNSTSSIVMSSLITPACAVTNTAINVPLGDIKRTVFTGVGSASPAQNFSIPLSCVKSSKVNISIAPGASGAYNATTGVINIDPATSGVKATGVGIQLIYNNAAIPLNTAQSVGSVTGEGAFNVPLSARYYQTASTVTAGSANGTATFVMTYN